MTEPQSARINQRLAGPQDEPFLRLLFALNDSVLSALPETLRASLLEMQYNGRALSYAAEFPAAENWILLTTAGEPVGRHLLARSGNDVRTVDISVLPAHQGQGYATSAIRQLQEALRHNGGNYGLRVYKVNSPAVRLYRHLGFESVSEDELALEMLWRA